MNATAEFTFGGSDHLCSRTAWLPGGARQTTAYLYGVTKDTTPP